MKKKKIVVAITGASGSIYANQLIKTLEIHPHVSQLSIVMSETAKIVWETELESKPIFRSKQYTNTDFHAPFASGSSVFDALVIIPCSMGSLAKIAHGIADNLISRAADVTLKEKKQLIIVPRETPLNLIHIRNMEQLTLAGATIMPATPSFYQKPKTIDEIINNFCNRILDLLDLDNESFRW